MFNQKEYLLFVEGTESLVHRNYRGIELSEK